MLVSWALVGVRSGWMGWGSREGLEVWGLASDHGTVNEIRYS